MNKKPKKKLTLQVQTVRKLSAASLSKVVGGMVATSQFSCAKLCGCPQSRI